MNKINFLSVTRRKPQAIAIIKGSDKYPSLSGFVRFYQTNYGVIVLAEISGLPKPEKDCKQPIFAFHIHSGSSCTGDANDAFAAAMSHYNPGGCQHPYHAGDLPPLFGANGRAFSMFLTDRFSVKEIVGKTVIIHSGPDDFSSQPAGNSGNKIACGVIRPQ